MCAPRTPSSIPPMSAGATTSTTASSPLAYTVSIWPCPSPVSLTGLGQGQIDTVYASGELAVVEVVAPADIGGIELGVRGAHILATQVHRGIGDRLAVKIDSDRLSRVGSVGRMDPAGDGNQTRRKGIDVLLVAAQGVTADVFVRRHDVPKRGVVAAQLLVERFQTGVAPLQVLTESRDG